MGYSIWDLITQNDPFYSEKGQQRPVIANPRAGRATGTAPVEHQSLSQPRQVVLPQLLFQQTGVPMPAAQELPLPPPTELPLPIAAAMPPPVAPNLPNPPWAVAQDQPTVGTAAPRIPVQAQQLPAPQQPQEKGFFDRDWGQYFTSPSFLMGANLLANSSYDPMKQTAMGAFGTGLAGGVNSIAEMQKWQAVQKAKSLEGSMHQSISTAAKEFGCDPWNDAVCYKKAFNRAVEYKRTGEYDRAAGGVYEKGLDRAIEDMDAAEASSVQAQGMMRTVDREIKRVGGLEKFINKYQAYVHPLGGTVSDVQALANAIGFDTDNEGQREFLVTIEQYNTDMALQGMAALGGNDSNEELKRVSAKFPGIRDAGPLAMLQKAAVMELETTLKSQKHRAKVAELQRDKLHTDYAGFEGRWDKKQADIIRRWEKKNEKLFSYHAAPAAGSLDERARELGL